MWSVVEVVEEMGYEARPMPGAQRTAVGIVGNDGRVDASRIAALPGVVQIIHVTQPYKQVSREWRTEDTIVTIAPGVSFGGNDVPVIAGPCSVESEEQILESARLAKDAGATALRGGAFKPRSSPYSFQGLGKRGLELLALARKETGLPIVTEAMDDEGAHLVAEWGDCIQIGARNMQNYSLLKTVGRLGKPVLLKRGMAADDQRPAAQRRVYPVGRKSKRHSLRARGAELRPGNAQSARSDGHTRCSASYRICRLSRIRVMAPVFATRSRRWPALRWRRR